MKFFHWLCCFKSDSAYEESFEIALEHEKSNPIYCDKSRNPLLRKYKKRKKLKNIYFLKYIFYIFYKFK